MQIYKERDMVTLHMFIVSQTYRSTHPPALGPSFTSDWFVKDKAGVLIIN